MNRTSILVLLVIGTSCTHRLVPTWYNAKTDNEPIAEITDQNVTVAAQNLELKDEYLVFDLEIINNSNEDISLDLDSLHTYISDTKFNEPDSLKNMAPLKGFKFNAMSLEAVDLMYEERIKSRQSAGVLLAILGAGLIIYDAAKDIQDFSDENWTRQKELESVGRDAMVTTSLLALNVASNVNEHKQFYTVEDLHYLPQEMLRVSEVTIGESVRGKIYFRNKPYNKFVRLIVPIGETSFVFDFKRANSAERQKIEKSY